MTDVIPSRRRLLTYGTAVFAILFVGLVLIYRLTIG
jgi:hypothetical protein